MILCTSLERQLFGQGPKKKSPETCLWWREGYGSRG